MSGKEQETQLQRERLVVAAGQGSLTLASIQSRKTRRPRKAALGKHSGRQVIALPKKSVEVVTQEDLETIFLLRRRAHEAADRLEVEEAKVRRKLEAGARIEEGVHSARLVQVVEVS